jgi:glucoamylase
MDRPDRSPPGWPGIPARWTSSVKPGGGVSLGSKSRGWLTLSHGIFNEIYSPRIDQSCVRAMGLIVKVGPEFLSEKNATPIQGFNTTSHRPPVSASS